MAQIDLNDVIASELTAQGLLTALNDLWGDIFPPLNTVEHNHYDKTAVNALINQLNHSNDSISAIIYCLEKINDSNIANLNNILHSQLQKGGDKQ